MSLPPREGPGPLPPSPCPSGTAPPNLLPQAHQEVLLKSLLAAPGSFAKTVPLLSAAGANQAQQTFASFFFYPPSSCPIAIKRPVYYETWPLYHPCSWLCGANPELRAYRDAPLGGWLQPLPAPLPPTQGPEGSGGGHLDHGASGLRAALAGLALQEERLWATPREGPPTAPKPSPSQDRLLHCTRKRFFSFPKLRSTSKKHPRKCCSQPSWAWHGAALCL